MHSSKTVAAWGNLALLQLRPITVNTRFQDSLVDPWLLDAAG